MATDPYPGATEDDLKSLDALAAQGLPFEVAFDGWEGPTPKPIAQKAYQDLLEFYGKPVS